MVFLNPAAQYIWYGNDRAVDTYDLQRKLGWQFGAEYLITDQIGVEAVYSEQKPNIDSDPASHFIGVKDRRWHLDGLYYFAVPGKWVPYVVGGVGEGRLEYKVDSSYTGTAGFGDHHDRETELHLGGGVRYFVTDHISLRGDLRAVHSLDEHVTDGVASLGISYNFGGSKPAPAPVHQEAPPPPAPVAPPPPPPEPAAVYEKIKLSSEALFDFNKATVRPGARQALDELTDKLAHYPHQIETIKIYGHTDRIGSAEYNQKLSTERAETVKNYLVEHGIPAGKIRAEGKGSSEPITSDCKGTKRSKALIECLQPDRRVEIDISIERKVKP
jgi:OOP family OmpA-OmpF porin